GSGKSRTLYALLNAIDPKKHNIITLEDPIEYRIDGLNQVQISRKMSFADALRSVLRQDPDVILVGEIRDAETAKLCFQAAETGHLVFSTLHANGALEAVERLSNLGIDRLTLESNLRLSIAQRLEQRLCIHCSSPIGQSLVIECYRDELQEIYPADKVLNAHRKADRFSSCQFCHGGISGRVPILEWASVYENEESGKKTLGLRQSLKESKLFRKFQGDIHCEVPTYE
ncbi:MAG: GspE/PulE family protein, partial [Pseudobdellovibrionaceae bacterium]